MSGAGATLAALSAPARGWASRLAGLFAIWAIGMELATGQGFIAAVMSPPGVLLLVLAGLATLLAAAGEPFGGRGTAAGRACRTLALAGTGLLLFSPPISLATRDTRMLKVGEGQELPAGALPGLPALRVGELTLSPSGPVPLSKTVEVPLLTADGEEVRVGLFPPARLGGWRLAVFEFGYAPAVEWFGPDGRPIAEGYMMLGTFPVTEEDARLVEWLPKPNVMMGVGTFPPKVEDLLTPPGSRWHLHLRLQEATLAGSRRTLADPEAYRYVMDGRPSAPTLYVEAFEGTERRFAGTIAGGSGAEFPGGRVQVGKELLLWADLQAVRDPFVELFLLGGILLSCGALGGVGVFALGRLRRR
jgi:hypothetical protein